jgi:uncharacterized protein YbjT (DUF2867 family)
VNVFVTGGTGYIGSRLIPALLRRGHVVRALVRAGSEKRLPAGQGVVGDALRADSYTHVIPPADTFVHLIGVAHPSPVKGVQFRAIDLVSIQVAAKAAHDGGIKHFVYLSVAQPAPVMQEFQNVRRQGEELIRASGMSATLVRPWYVLGPGHWWPYPMLPFYWLAERLPSFKESASRLGFVTIQEMVETLVWSVENPANGVRVLGVPEIRAQGIVVDSR